MRTASWPRFVRSPLVVDTGLAVALTAVSILQGLDDDSGRWRPFDLTAAALSALATLPTVARRRAPVPVVLVCYTFWVWQVVLGYNPVVTTYGMLLAMYAVAASRPLWHTAAALAPGAVLWVVVGLAAHAGSLAGLVLQALAIPAAIWKVADSARHLDRTNRLLAEANEQLRRDREERARRAVADERVRIARELHDVVAHHMSVISVQAGLARYVLRTDPQTAEAALGTVLAADGEALDEMRRMLALLRAADDGPAEPPAYAPAPGLLGLPDLIERVRTAGVPIRLDVTGRPRPLPPGIQLCVYRVVQEGLTNVLKHAAPATATVTLDYGPDRITATVRDDGARREAPATGRPGQGLIGMRERAMLYGGTADAAPLPGGGFEVRLVLPLPAHGAEGEGAGPAR
ncbi:ATPase [Amorphoplanes nipponensis]|uniref:histidine kinase n=1 Tax=Actinoplanes nipponensis TaxID=135950 RepID=A0A919JMK3_9ACTN|nr:sensor histidine kinase [Actinoplanes nipponensis]GIE53819.1 ATPase [Actinoplanes nipponensis]